MAYVYKITFEEVPHFYIGVRGRDPDGDPYLGSPKTHKCYWEIYTPKKQIMWVYDSWDEAYGVEKALIKGNLGNKYCLNRCAGGGVFHSDVCSKAGQALHRRRSNDPEFDAEFRKNCAKGAEVRDERRRNDPKFDAKFRGDRAEGGATAAKDLQERRLDDSKLDARLREASAKAAKALHERRRSDQELNSRLLKASQKAGNATSSQRWQCTVTGHISTPGSLSRYQKKRGINTSNRIKLL